MKHMPAPQEWTPESPPAGVERVAFSSGPLTLFGWYARPANLRARVPVLVYLHGGFSFSADDFQLAAPALQHEFAVFTPTTRGENGNPGDFELMMGEVDDALAAVAWLKQQENVDPARIYVAGHSNGGAIAALACLRPDSGIAACGNVAGVYDVRVFRAWSKAGWVPFDLDSAPEVEARLFVPQLGMLAVPLFIYLPVGDGWSQAGVDALRARNPRFVDAQLMEVDHTSVIGPALADFLRRAAGAR